ncbi:hypothetical protein ACC806_38725, partial [Rhizobium ruizarguesonis]
EQFQSRFICFQIGNRTGIIYYNRQRSLLDFQRIFGDFWIYQQKQDRENNKKTQNSQKPMDFSAVLRFIKILVK